MMEFQHVTVLLNEMINLIVTDPEGYTSTALLAAAAIRWH